MFDLEDDDHTPTVEVIGITAGRPGSEKRVPLRKRLWNILSHYPNSHGNNPVAGQSSSGNIEITQSTEKSGVSNRPQNDPRIQKYVERQRYWMEYLNAAPHIIYENDVGTYFPNESNNTLKAKQDEQLKGYGIARDASTGIYSYSGDNPALALDNLLKVDPLYLECNGAIVLTIYLALKDILGVAKFNRLIANMEGGKLVLELGCMPSIYKSTIYTRPLEETHDGGPIHLESSDFKAGSMVHIAGPAPSRSFHPGSELNGYNLLWIEPDGFLGFSSREKPLKTQSEYITILEDAFKKDLTRLDVHLIHIKGTGKPNEFSLFSTRSNKEICELVFEKNPSAFEIVANMYKTNLESKLNTASVPVPDAFKNMPAVGATYVQYIDPTLFYLYINEDINGLRHELYKERFSIVEKSKPIPPYTPIDELDFKSFVQDKGYQQKIVAELKHFYHRTQDRVAKKQMGGLVLQGGAGTGKTSACTIALDALEKKGFQIWRAFLEQPILPDDLYLKLLSTRSKEDESVVMKLLIQHMSPIWKNYDIFFIDDVNGEAGQHTWVALALEIYCKENKKQFLMTTNAKVFDIFDCFRREFPWFRIALVMGEDYRIENAWWKKTLGVMGKLPASAPILSVTQTPDQDYLLSCLERFAPVNSNSGLWVTGKPGIGKTTLIDAFFKNNQKNVLKVTPKHDPKDSLERIKAFNGEYIWLEDVNEVSFCSNLGDMFEYLLDNNEKREPNRVRKIIITSNNLSPENAAHEFSCILKEQLEERYQSRMQSFFFHVRLESTQDLREKSSDKRNCYIRHASAAAVLADPYVFTVSNWHHEMALDREKLGYGRQASYRNRAKKILEHATSVRLQWDEEPGYAFMNYEMALLLEGMETGQKSLEIVLPDSMSIDEWFQKAQKKYKGSYDPDKYMYLSSRLSRLQIISSSQPNEKSCLTAKMK